MPTLAERRAAVAAAGGQGASGDFIKFSTEGETRILRFLFNDANSIEVHKKFWDKDQQKWIIDGEQGSFKITFNCVEYDKGGANPRRVRFEISQYLYDEYLSPYVEKDVPASKNVWEIKVRRPKTMDISYVAFRVEGATELNYPIPEATQSSSQPTQAQTAAAPTYANNQQAAAAPAQPQTAPAPQPTAPATPAPKKSKYF